MHKAFLLDVGHIIEPIAGSEGITEGVIRLTLRQGDSFFFRRVAFNPYFYFEGRLPDELRNVPQIKEIFPVEMKRGGKPVKLSKITCHDPTDIPKLKSLFSKFGKCHWHDVPYVRQFTIETGVRVFSYLHYTEKEDGYIEISKCVEGQMELNRLSFDIETYNPRGVPRPSEDPLIMVSHFSGGGSVLTFRETGFRHAVVLKDERDTISRFCSIVRGSNTDILYGYNTSDFDLPYMRERAERLKSPLPLGRDNSAPVLRRRGYFSSASIMGRLHIDVFHMVRFLAGIGALKTNTYTLEEVHREIFGKEKIDIPKNDIWKMWNDEEGRALLAEYSLDDAKSTYMLGEKFLPIFIEVARIAGITLEEAVSSTTGQLVEHVLLNETHRRGLLAPNKPSGSEAISRDDEPIEGAYVKVPDPGIYDNIAVFDFRSLYPSIIVSHNISPETLNCGCCTEEESHISPGGHRFCSRKKGLIPEVLSTLLSHRAKLKGQLKSLDTKSDEYAYAHARQYAFKIIANSFYGMLRYVRARWYCRECAEATTAWERHYIKDVIAKAESEGFRVLYSDTDSIFLVYKSDKDALDFMGRVNRHLPKDMELELEDFYTRGLFVSKKSGKAGAKKKYALLSRDGSIKIRGFELVRRDWSGVAKETQRKVLETVLKDGDLDKALAIINGVVDRLRAGDTPLKDLVIHTVLRKGVEKYKSLGPEVLAARKAAKRGFKMGEGSMVSYVITGKGATISDKAEVVDFVEEGDYDAEYYISNQVIPAVEKILGELGYRGDILKSGKKQQGLSDWL